METGEQRQTAAPSGTELARRERRVLRRVRRVLGPREQISVALVATLAGDRLGARRVLALTDGGLLVVRHPYVRRPAVVRRYERTAVGATSVAAGNSYVDVDGHRWKVGGAWTYQLFRLQQLAATDQGAAAAAPAAG